MIASLLGTDGLNRCPDWQVTAGAGRMGVLDEQSGFLQRCRESRKLVLIIVAIALLLDNMLLTTVGQCAAGGLTCCQLTERVLFGKCDCRVFLESVIVVCFWKV